jgi:predicted ATPase/DNA-binding SARP family transcriptional activator
MTGELPTESANLTGAAAPPFLLRLFGPMEVWRNGEPLPRVRARKGQWLLALLALRGAPVERSWLAGMLWPESRDTQAAHSLRMLLTDLRKTLGPAADRLCSPTPQTLSLDLTGAVVDVLAFDRAVARGDEASLEEAVALYRGPLLEGCTEAWAFQEQRVREQAVLEALETLAGKAWERRDLPAAERHLRRAVSLDPLRESAQRALMQVLAAGGSEAAAIQVYRDLRTRLHEEVNAEPDPQTTALFQQIRSAARRQPFSGALLKTGAGERGSGGLPGRTGAFEAERALGPTSRSETPAHNLPQSLTSFVGRERELEELQRWMGAARLLMLTGPGGCGKTRLALETAWRLLHDFPDGVWLVELASLVEPSRLGQTVVTALGISQAPSVGDAPAQTERPALAVLTDCLKGKKLLLILDNCEHLVDPCARLAEALLRDCPHLRVLATSRESLGIPGETIWRVPCLSLPPPVDGSWLRVDGPARAFDAGVSTSDPLFSALMQFEAVRLFVERATAALPTFRLSERTARTIARICRRLDGIPLAIELAAARVRALPLDELAVRLEDQLRLLTGGSRTAPPRHQTLRGALDWGYHLLTAAEQALLRRLSVFAGGFTLEAAEVIGSDGDGNVLDLLTGLVDKSLVQYDEQEGDGRYRLLETIRQYSEEKLRDTGETVRLQSRHRDFYLELAERAAPELRGREQVRWLDRLEQEHDNLRAALRWSLRGAEEAGGGADAALRLVAALRRFWFARGYLAEARDWLRESLQGGGSPAARARALVAVVYVGSVCDPAASRSQMEEALALFRRSRDPEGAAYALLALGTVAALENDLMTAQASFEECQALFREMGDLRGVADALLGLGEIAWRQEDSPTARARYEEGLALYRQVGDQLGIVASLYFLGLTIWRLGDLASARACFQQSLSASRELKSLANVGGNIGFLANIARIEGDLVTARALFEEHIAIFRTLGRLGGAAWGHLGLGIVAFAQGDVERARSSYTEALTLFEDAARNQTSPTNDGIVFALERFAALAAAEGQTREAARLLGATATYRESSRFPLPPVDREEYYDALVAGLRTELGEQALANEWREGAAMTLEQAVCVALEECEIPIPDRKGS